jgi:hypothetical protein
LDKLNNRNIIKTSHELNHFRGGYTPLELDFIYAFISCIKNEDEEFKTYSITLDELEKKLDKRLQLSKIEYLFDSLITKSFKINNAKELRVYAFFQSFIYNKETKLITVRFNEELKPHLLQLKTYAMGNFRYILQFRGEYTKRIYMLLSQWVRVGKVAYSVAEIREMLEVSKKLSYGEFKRNLLRSQAELKKKSNFFFEFEEKKEGRKVVELRFKLKENDKELEAFKDLIKEEYYHQKLYEFDGKMTYCNRDGDLYYFDDDLYEILHPKKYADSCWKQLFKRKNILPIFTQPSLFQMP